jgi:DMSO/TMAO reductase YedYZ molybdopterin-dependent catalytic subunit
MAQEFAEADLSPTFRSNGTAMPADPRYAALAAGEFAAYRLEIGGLVEEPASLSLSELRALPSRTQITRHDCVEGWSAIGKWRGARLAAVLAAVRPQPRARFVVFYCADPMDSDGGSPYYESIDMEDALHPQTLLAYELNDRTLPIPNGAPVRLRVERQLGYKHAKYIMRIELVESFAGIRGGKGGYWEDQGYEWWAGI